MKYILTRNEEVRKFYEKTRKNLIVRLTKPTKIPFDGTLVVDLPGPMVKVSGSFKGRISLSELPEEVASVVEEGDIIVIGDSKVVLRVRGSEAEVIVPGEVKDEQIHVIGKDLPISGPTEEDKIMAEIARELDAHAVLISMVRSADDVRRYSSIIPKNALRIAKIETIGAIRDLERILEIADAAILARGDLELNAYPEELYLYKRRLASVASSLGKPYFAGTGYLKSLIGRYLPERCEIDDIGLAFDLGYDAILLTKESSEKAAMRFERIVDKLAKRAHLAEASSFEEALRLSLEAKRKKVVEAIRFVGDEREAKKAYLLRGVTL